MKTVLSIKRGFTLIELLVVVLIIGILASIALPQYTAAVEKSRAAEYMTMTKAIGDAQQRFFLEQGVYADSADLLDISLPSGFTPCVVWMGTYYYNSITQIGVTPTWWGMGSITGNTACNISRRNFAVMTYVPGIDPSCPATEKRPCMYCIVVPTNKAARKACASIGTYAGRNGSNNDTFKIAG